MLVKTTIQEIFESIVKGEGKITDNSICGKCSKCGECCTPYLPITQKELFRIAEFVEKNNIKPQRQLLVMQNRLSCPYHDGKKCLIYEVRPLICREFYCYKQVNMELANKFINEKRYTIDMWKFADDMERRKSNWN